MFHITSILKDGAYGTLSILLMKSGKRLTDSLRCVYAKHIAVSTHGMLSKALGTLESCDFMKVFAVMIE